MTLQDAIQFACSNGWLAQQTREFQSALSSRVSLKTWTKDKLVYHFEDNGSEMFGLVEGSLAVTVSHPAMGTVAAHIMHPGDWFGEVAVLSRGSRLVTVHSRTACRFIVISKSSVAELLKINADFSYAFFDLMRINHETSLRSGIDLLINDARARLCARMLTLGGAKESALPEVPFILPVTQEELALTSCLSRNFVNQNSQRAHRARDLRRSLPWNRSD